MTMTDPVNVSNNGGDRVDRLIRELEKRLGGRRLSDKNRKWYRRRVTSGALAVTLNLTDMLKKHAVPVLFICDAISNSCAKQIKFLGGSVSDTEPVRPMAVNIVAKALAAKKNLKTLVIDGCDMPSVLPRFITSAASGGVLRNLVVRECTVDDACTKAIASAVTTCNLTGLSLNNVTISDGNVKVLSDGLKVSKSLQGFDFQLRRNVTAEIVAEALATSPSLQWLSLGFKDTCNADLGVEVIMKGLVTNRTLKSVLLVGGHVKKRGALATANMLTQNTTLEKLSFQDSNMGFVCAKTIASGLAQTSSLKQLGFVRSKLGTEGAMEIFHAMMKNGSCIKVYIGGNDNVDKELLKKIARLAEINKNSSDREQGARQKATEFGHGEVLSPLPAKGITNDEAMRKGKNPAVARPASGVTSMLITSMLDTVPDDILLQQVRKRKLIDLSTNDDFTLQADGSGKGLQNLINQQQQYATSLVKVKKEKADTEESLAEAKDDCDDANELVQQQTLTVDIWQGRFDEVAKLAEAAGVDIQQINVIRRRSLSSGR